MDPSWFLSPQHTLHLCPHARDVHLRKEAGQFWCSRTRSEELKCKLKVLIAKAKFFKSSIACPYRSHLCPAQRGTGCTERPGCVAASRNQSLWGEDEEDLPLLWTTWLPVLSPTPYFAAGTGVACKEGRGSHGEMQFRPVCPAPCLFPAQNNDLL